jgi:hypothetical protein
MTPVWNGKEWTCEIALPAWRSFLHARTTDRVDVVLLLDEDHPDASPSEAQLATIAHIVAVQDEIRLAVEGAMRKYYDDVRPKYVAFALRAPNFMGDIATNMPENPDPSTFAHLHELDGVFVHPIVAGDLAYVGFSFRATWDPEHGVGVMTHDRRTVDVGGADTALLTWIARKNLPDGAKIIKGAD